MRLHRIESTVVLFAPKRILKTFAANGFAKHNSGRGWGWENTKYVFDIDGAQVWSERNICIWLSSPGPIPWFPRLPSFEYSPMVDTSANSNQEGATVAGRDMVYSLAGPGCWKGNAWKK